MRKILSLGLLALVLSSVSTLLLAGYPTCEADSENLKEAGVYGWCNAWFDADTQEDKDRIADRIRERAEGYDLDLSWLDQLDCPCWTQAGIEAAGFGNTEYECFTNLALPFFDYDFLALKDPSFDTEYLSGFNILNGTICQVRVGQVTTTANLNSDDEEVACRTTLRSAAEVLGYVCGWSN